jgi:hypothetical protein
VTPALQLVLASTIGRPSLFDRISAVTTYPMPMMIRVVVENVVENVNGPAFFSHPVK